MTKIKVASEVGFCFGVERAINLAKRATEGAKGKVYSYGQLVHNRRVVEELRVLGMEPLEEITAQVPKRGDVLVVRAHGAPPEVFEEMERRGVKIVDTTCPIVKGAIREAALLKEGNYKPIIVGDRKHPEVRGIVGRLGGEAVVVGEARETESLNLPPKLGVMAQTTESLESLAAVVSALLPKAKEIKVVNTICEAVRRRQEEVKELAEGCDVMVVVGGRNSANTKRLVKIARRFCPKVFHLEEPYELDDLDIPEGATIGVSAGTSTPKELVEEVVARLRQIVGEV